MVLPCSDFTSCLTLPIVISAAAALIHYSISQTSAIAFSLSKHPPCIVLRMTPVPSFTFTAIAQCPTVNVEVFSIIYKTVLPCCTETIEALLTEILRSALGSFLKMSHTAVHWLKALKYVSFCPGRCRGFDCFYKLNALF